MRKRLTSSFLRGAAFGIGIATMLSIQAALAWVIHGRNSEGANEIIQTGISASSVEQAITATPSGTILTSYQLSAGVSQVTTVATIGDGVKMPSVTALGPPTNLDASLNMIVINHTSNSLNIWPFASSDVFVSGGSALGAGAALALPSNKVASCYSVSIGRWYCQIA
jgi:hypothetical protein